MSFEPHAHDGIPAERIRALVAVRGISVRGLGRLYASYRGISQASGERAITRYLAEPVVPYFAADRIATMLGVHVSDLGVPEPLVREKADPLAADGYSDATVRDCAACGRPAVLRRCARLCPPCRREAWRSNGLVQVDA